MIWGNDEVLLKNVEQYILCLACNFLPKNIEYLFTFLIKYLPVDAITQILADIYYILGYKLPEAKSQG